MHHNKSHIKELILLVLFSLLWKVTILILAVNNSNPDLFIAHDTESYMSSAQALLQTGTFSISPDNLEPQTIRTPGYPIFLALMHGLVGENQIAVLVVQILFSLGTIVLVYWMGCKLWNSTTGLVASLLLALDMNSISYTMIVLSETLFTFFLCAFLAAVVYTTSRDMPIQAGGRRRLVVFLCGTFLAVTTHIRPISYYLIFLMVILCLFWGVLKKWDRKTLLIDLAFFSLPLLLLIGGWQVRNYLQTGSSQFCAIENLSLINYRAAMIVAERDGISRDEAIMQITRQYGLDRNSGWNDEWREVGVKIITENPLIFLKQYIEGLASIFLGPGSENLAVLSGVKIESTSPLGDIRRLSPEEYLARWIIPHPVYFSAFVISLIHMLLLYVGVALWMIQVLFKRRFEVGEIFLFIVMLYFVALSAGPEAYSRFRVPITPVLALLSSAAFLFHRSDGRITSAKGALQN